MYCKSIVIVYVRYSIIGQLYTFLEIIQDWIKIYNNGTPFTFHSMNPRPVIILRPCWFSLNLTFIKGHEQDSSSSATFRSSIISVRKDPRGDLVESNGNKGIERRNGGGGRMDKNGCRNSLLTFSRHFCIITLH